MELQETCSRCGSNRWVSISLDEGWTRVAQCVPCGAIGPKLGKGWRQLHYERGQEIRCEKERERR